MNIFVGNLSFDANQADVQRAFASFGTVASVVIVMEKKGKKSRGFGFVEMPNEQEALAAIAQLQGKDILGRPVNVMPALSKEPKQERVAAEDKQLPVYKRTGKYREGRRTINYIKKRLDAGVAVAPAGERKYKSNPMRWRKKPRWVASSPKPEGEAKPWQKTAGAAKSARPWKKPEGEAKPWQKTAGAAKPWRKSSDARQQPNFKKSSSPSKRRR